jgi:hypothetical protein
VKSAFGFTNQAAAHPYRLQLTDTDLTLENLGTQPQARPAVARLAGQLMGRGATRLTATLQRKAGSADVDVTAQIEGAELVRLKDLVQAYGGFEIAAGEMSVYSELQMRNGALDGYVKPLLRGVEVGGDGEVSGEKTLRQRVCESAIGIGAKVLKNRLRGEVATVVPISGRVDRPRVGRWETVGGLLRNAFLHPVVPGYESARGGRRESPLPPDRSAPEGTRDADPPAHESP